MSPSNIDIVVKAKDGELVFVIKDPDTLNKELLNDLGRDFSNIQRDSIVIYPEQTIIDSQWVFLEDTCRLI